MTHRIKFNANDSVRIRLTDTGRAIHRKNHDDFVARAPVKLDYTPPPEDENGWSEWPLWVLMKEFGAHMHMAAVEPPFWLDIEFDVREGFPVPTAADSC